jgi:hypothetical protein
MASRIAIGLVAALMAISPATASAAYHRKAPHLSYKRAKRAIQRRANLFAGTPTKITSMYRRLDQGYSAQAEWDRENPTGCAGCGYDPVSNSFYDTPTTESCSVGLQAKLLRSGRVRVSVEDFACY